MIISGTYDQCKLHIKDGDIVYIKNGFNLVNKIVQWISGSPYYHCGICVWLEGDQVERKLMILEASEGGRRLVSLSSYSNHPMDVIRVDNTWCIDNIEVIDDLFIRSGDVPYSYWRMVVIAAKEMFGITLKSIKTGEVCSDLINHYLSYYRQFQFRPDFSPGKQVEILKDMGYTPIIEIQPRQ